MKGDKIKEIVRKKYSEIAKGSGCGSSCCGPSAQSISKSIGYSEEEMGNVPEANLGLGCGNPIAISDIKEGDVVLDLGSGAGLDTFLASKRAGKTGRVIGLDFSEDMVKKSRSFAKKYGYANVDFRLGDIESMPVEDGSVDIIISNCVINLAPDKGKVFSEAFRVLKGHGRMFVSDIVLLGKLTDKQKKDKDLISGCVAGALQKEDYLDKIRAAGFKVKILGEDKDISKRQYSGIALESLKVKAYK